MKVKQINYNKKIDALNMPWVESPFFHKLIEKLDIPKYKDELAKEFNAKGYVIIQLGLTKTFLEDLINEINSLSTSKDVSL